MYPLALRRLESLLAGRHAWKNLAVAWSYSTQPQSILWDTKTLWQSIRKVIKGYHSNSVLQQNHHSDTIKPHPTGSSQFICRKYYASLTLLWLVTGEAGSVRQILEVRDDREKSIHRYNELKSIFCPGSKMRK